MSAEHQLKSDVCEDEVLALVEAREADIDRAALAVHCSAKLPPFMLPRFMVPRHYRAVPVLPHTPTGKFQKNELRGFG